MENGGYEAKLHAVDAEGEAEIEDPEVRASKVRTGMNKSFKFEFGRPSTWCQAPRKATFSLSQSSHTGAGPNQVVSCNPGLYIYTGVCLKPKHVLCR